MKSHCLISLYVLLQLFGVSPSLSQVGLRSVGLGAQAEAGYLIDGQIEWKVEADTSNDLSDFDVRADVFRGTGTSFAGQNILVAAGGDSLVLDGVALAGGSRQESGVRLYLRSWTTANGVVDVGEGCSFQFSGKQSPDAHTKLYLVNWDSGAEVLVPVTGGESGFEYSGQLPGAGIYAFQVALEFLHISSEPSDLQDEVRYSLRISPSASVATEVSSWGVTKLLYR